MTTGTPKTPEEIQEYLEDNFDLIVEAVNSELPSSSGLTMAQIRQGIIAAIQLINDSQKFVQNNSSQVVPLESQAVTRVNNDEILTPSKGTAFQLRDQEKTASYGNASKTVTYFQPNQGTQASLLLTKLDYGKAFALHEQVNSTKLNMILHESLVEQIYGRDLTGVNEVTMLFTGDARGRLGKSNQTADPQFAINWNGDLIPATNDPNELNPSEWVAPDDSVTETWSTSVKGVCYSAGALANRGSTALRRGDVVYTKTTTEELGESELLENPIPIGQNLLTDSVESSQIVYDANSEFFVMPIIAGGGTFNVIKIFQLFMGRKYQTVEDWGSLTFEKSSDCIGTILKIAYDAAIAEEEKEEEEQQDALLAGIALGKIYAKNVKIG